MVGDIRVTYFSKPKMACIEFSSDNDFYIERWNLIVLFHFENRQVFLLHPWRSFQLWIKIRPDELFVSPRTKINMILQSILFFFGLKYVLP